MMMIRRPAPFYGLVHTDGTDSDFVLDDNVAGSTTADCMAHIFHILTRVDTEEDQTSER